MGFLGCNGISWTMCKQSAPCSWYHTDTSSLNFYRPDALPDAQQCQSIKGKADTLCTVAHLDYREYTHTHTRLAALCPGLPGWASTRKAKPIWILLKQETLSGNWIRWAICKFAPCFRQITMPAPHRSVFYRPDALPVAQPTVSKHWSYILSYHNGLVLDNMGCCSINSRLNV